MGGHEAVVLMKWIYINAQDVYFYIFFLLQQNVDFNCNILTTTDLLEESGATTFIIFSLNNLSFIK